MVTMVKTSLLLMISSLQIINLHVNCVLSIPHAYGVKITVLTSRTERTRIQPAVFNCTLLLSVSVSSWIPT